MASISKYIKDQFPSFYQEGGEDFITFVEAYYEFIESDPRYSKLILDDMGIDDIDTTLPEFVSHFKSKYLDEFPYISSVDRQFVIKHVMDYYQSKGSEKSVKLLLRLLLGQETDVYYPGQDVLKPSDSKWVNPVYLELTREPRSRGFVNKQIRGSSSGAVAFVDSIVTKRIDGKLIDIAYLTDVRGMFRVNEVVTDDGDLKGAPLVIGSLTTLDVDLGGRNNSIGDIFDVVSNGGSQGKVRVTETVDATGRVDFRIHDGGYGFEAGDGSDVKVSSSVLLTSNPDRDYMRGEWLVQRRERVDLISATDFSSNAVVGDYVMGYNTSNVVVSMGKLVSISNTTIDGSLTSDPSPYATIQVHPELGSFDSSFRVDTAEPHLLSVGDQIKTGGELSMLLINLAGNIDVGDTVYQRRYIDHDLPLSNTTVQALIYETSGRVTAKASNTVISLDRVFGEFVVGVGITDQANTALAVIDSMSNHTPGSSGRVITVNDASSVIISDIAGDFLVGDRIKTEKGSQKEVISVLDEGAAQVTLGSDMDTMAVLDDVANTSFRGQLVGQNTTAIGLWGNTTPLTTNFIGRNGIEHEIPLTTIREDTMLSPPQFPDGSVREISRVFDAVATGIGAGFRVGAVENEETITILSDMLGGKNVANVAYMKIGLDGKGSSIGFLDSITVTNPGSTSYSNGQIVAFTGGGYAGGDPDADAQGLVHTDSSGNLSHVEILDHGMGYHSQPTHNLPGDATLAVNMSYGYGFPKSPVGDHTTVMDYLLSTASYRVGSISSLDRINPGVNYNMNPFVWVNHPVISAMGRRNFYIHIDNMQGGFSIGERLYQVADGIEHVKGEVIWSTRDTILVRRTSVSISLVPNESIYGMTTGSSATIIGYFEDADSYAIGDNADIEGRVISANGIATKVEVIDSGYGYVDGQPAELVSEKSQFTITASVNIQNQGRGTGYWKSDTSHLNSDKKIHDNNYYQEFSYDIRCGLSLDKYSRLAKEMIHVAGTKMFGTVVKNSIHDLNLTARCTSVTPRRLPEWEIYNLLKSGSDHLEVFWPDPEYWYQDVDGNVPVTMEDQPVRLWKSLSGNGLVQTTNDDFAPTATKIPLIARRNLFIHTEDIITPSRWNKSNVNDYTYGFPDPFGGNRATRWKPVFATDPGGATRNASLYQTSVDGTIGKARFSLYVKPVRIVSSYPDPPDGPTRDRDVYVMLHNQVKGMAYFNLRTMGVEREGDGVVNTGATEVGGGWWRIWYTAENLATSSNGNTWVSFANRTTQSNFDPYPDGNEEVHIFGPMFESGDYIDLSEPPPPYQSVTSTGIVNNEEGADVKWTLFFDGIDDRLISNNLFPFTNTGTYFMMNGAQITSTEGGAANERYTTLSPATNGAWNHFGLTYRTQQNYFTPGAAIRLSQGESIGALSVNRSSAPRNPHSLYSTYDNGNLFVKYSDWLSEHTNTGTGTLDQGSYNIPLILEGQSGYRGPVVYREGPIPDQAILDEAQAIINEYMGFTS